MRGLTLLALVCGCSGGEPAVDDCADAPVTSWDNVAAGFLTQNCQGCHASTAPDRHDAPADVTFDTEEDALRWADAIQRTAVSAEGPCLRAAGSRRRTATGSGSGSTAGPDRPRSTTER